MSLVDVNGTTDLAQLEKDLAEATSAAPAATGQPAPADAEAQQTTPVVLDGDNIPEKFRGKTVDDLVKSYQSLESEFGRQANDLGAQRRITDQLLALEARQTTEQSQPSVEVTAERLLDNPAEALEEYLQARDASATQATTQRLDALEATIAQERFLERHSDFEAIGKDPQFYEWMSATPYRARLQQQAANGDWQAADELMQEFKATRPAGNAPNTDQQASTTLDDARKASLESGSSTDAGTASSGKTYRRSDLVRLRLEKPDVYSDPSFQEEILKAYAEGRVK